MPSDRRPLIVRLRNWVGDVTLCLPLLQRLAQAGYALRLVGKGWAGDLLAGEGWPVQVLPKTLAERVALLKRMKREALAQDPGFRRRVNALCLPDSFSSAVDFRLAGLRAMGHANEGRSLLLGRAVPRQRGVHELAVYWEFGNALLGAQAPLPAALRLRVTPAQMAQARALRVAHRIGSGCIFICPFAGGTWNQLDKTWPAFAEFVARDLPAFGRSIVVCPGPGEEAVATAQFAGATRLPGVDLGTYAALLQSAALMIANDTGPGHIAAAVGTPLISVLGPSDAALWRAWGPRVRVLQGQGTWPSTQAVRQAVVAALATG